MLRFAVQEELKTAIVVGALLGITIDAAAQQNHFDGRTLWKHVEVLASDDMEGRATGSPGLERAQALVLGVNESDLGDAARRVAASHGVAMDVDLEPQSNRFTCCSDQRSFVFAGIPAVQLTVGFPGDLNAVQQKWRRERYHTPFDDPQQPVTLETVAQFEEIARALLFDVANAPGRPEWKPTSVGPAPLAHLFQHLRALFLGPAIVITLMLNDGHDAASAAFEVGYESPSQFSREYARLFGAPPKRDVNRR